MQSSIRFDNPDEFINCSDCLKSNGLEHTLYWNIKESIIGREPSKTKFNLLRYFCYHCGKMAQACVPGTYLPDDGIHKSLEYNLERTAHLLDGSVVTLEPLNLKRKSEYIRSLHFEEGTHELKIRKNGASYKNCGDFSVDEDTLLDVSFEEIAHITLKIPKGMPIQYSLNSHLLEKPTGILLSKLEEHLLKQNPRGFTTRNNPKPLEDRRFKDCTLSMLNYSYAGSILEIRHTSNGAYICMKR